MYLFHLYLLFLKKTLHTIFLRQALTFRLNIPLIPKIWLFDYQRAEFWSDCNESCWIEDWAKSPELDPPEASRCKIIHNTQSNINGYFL